MHFQCRTGKTNLTAAKLIDHLSAVLTVQSLIKQFFTIYTGVILTLIVAAQLLVCLLINCHLCTLLKINKASKLIRQ